MPNEKDHLYKNEEGDALKYKTSCKKEGEHSNENDSTSVTALDGFDASKLKGQKKKNIVFLNETEFVNPQKRVETARQITVICCQILC
jgi:hypothetical protein